MLYFGVLLRLLAPLLLGTLRHQRFGQGQRLGAGLPPDNGVSRPNDIPEVQFAGIQFLHGSAPRLDLASQFQHCLGTLEQRPVDHLSLEIDGAESATRGVVIDGDEFAGMLGLRSCRGEDLIADFDLARHHADLALIAEVAPLLGIPAALIVVTDLDHRLIDGRVAVTALKIIKEAIEDPTRILIDL